MRLIELGCKCEVPWCDAFSPQLLIVIATIVLEAGQFRLVRYCQADSLWLATLFGGWLGSGADEGRAKLRYALGRRKEPLIQ